MPKFEWDEDKELANIAKHEVSFDEASLAFEDANLMIDLDERHSDSEARYHAYGLVNGKVMTVRFTYRDAVVRIFGAAYWRKGRKIYEKRQKR